MCLTESMLSRSFTISAIALVAAIGLMPAGAAARPHATPTPAATPTAPPEDPAVTTIAKREFVAWQAGIVNKSHYDPRTVATMTDKKLDDTSKALGVLGTLESVAWVAPLGIEDNTAKGYIYQMKCSNFNVYEFLTIGTDGKIQGIFFKDKLTDDPTPSPSP